MISSKFKKMRILLRQCSTSQHSNLSDIIRCSLQKLSGKKIISIQTLIEEIKTDVFEEDDLEYRDFGTKTVVLLLLINRDIKSDVEDSFHDLHKRIVCLNPNLSIDTLMGSKASIAEEM